MDLEAEVSISLINELINKAKEVLKNSYAPYSNIHVAAAILGSSNKIYLGVNIENSSYGLTICAERSAIASMITDGERIPIAVAVVTDYPKPIPPCGACRQVIAEFNKDALIIMHSIVSKETLIVKLSEIFPEPFKISNQ